MKIWTILCGLLGLWGLFGGLYFWLESRRAKRSWEAASRSRLRQELRSRGED